MITHHAPHLRSLHVQWRTPEFRLLNPAFASDLTPLLSQADVWVHGHVHDSFDYEVGRCRVVVNPRGYPLRGKPGIAAAGMPHENAQFDGACVIDV